jgi:hypothetical protein
MLPLLHSQKEEVYIFIPHSARKSMELDGTFFHSPFISLLSFFDDLSYNKKNKTLLSFFYFLKFPHISLLLDSLLLYILVFCLKKYIELNIHQIYTCTYDIYIYTYMYISYHIQSSRYRDQDQDTEIWIERETEKVNLLIMLLSSHFTNKYDKVVGESKWRRWID